MMILAFFVTACAPAIPTSGDALCDGTRRERAELASALASSPDDAAVRAGAALIFKLDAGCSA